MRRVARMAVAIVGIAVTLVCVSATVSATPTIHITTSGGITFTNGHVNVSGVDDRR